MKNDSERRLTRAALRVSLARKFRVTQKNHENLLLTKFGMFSHIAGAVDSYSCGLPAAGTV